MRFLRLVATSAAASQGGEGGEAIKELNDELLDALGTIIKTKEVKSSKAELAAFMKAASS